MPTGYNADRLDKSQDCNYDGVVKTLHLLRCHRYTSFLAHPDKACITKEAGGIAGRRLAEARRGATSGPEGCGQDVRN